MPGIGDLWNLWRWSTWDVMAPGQAQFEASMIGQEPRQLEQEMPTASAVSQAVGSFFSRILEYIDYQARKYLLPAERCRNRCGVMGNPWVMIFVYQNCMADQTHQWLGNLRDSTSQLSVAILFCCGHSVDPTLQHGLLSANAIVAEDTEIDGLVPQCFNSNTDAKKYAKDRRVARYLK